MDFDPVLKGVANGLVREEQLTWQDYQRLVAHVIKLQNLRLLASSEVTVSENEHSGEIDVVIRYMSPDVRIGAESSARRESIFVECKRRSRKLELDDVGKVFCYSIVHQPRALYIVSPFPLAPQAITCARQLFAFEGSSSGMFRQISIYHRTLRQLIAPAVPDATKDAAGIRLETWSVVIEDVFRNELVADDIFYPPTIEVPAGAMVSFTAVISGAARSRITARLRSGTRSVGEASVQTTSPSETVEIRFSITDEPVAIDGIELETDAPGSAVLHSLRPIEFVLASPSGIFGDLRKKEAAEFAERLAKPSAAGVTAIVGEAGVGKTYFCESVAQNLNRHHDFGTFHAIVTANDDYYVFLALIRHFFVPVSDRRTSKQGEIRSGAPDSSELALLGAILSHAGGQPENFNSFSGLLSRIARGRYEAADPALLLDAVVTAIKSRTRPQLVVLKNCHLMSPRTTALFQLLFSRLNADGWSHASFLLEYREKSQPQNSAWNKAISEISRDLGERLQKIEVLPLTLAQMVERVCIHIEAPSPQVTADVLIRQAGGNPLFIEHVMRELLHSKIVVRDASGGRFYRIDHFDLFRRRVEALPAQLDALLKYRIEAIVSGTPFELQTFMPPYLGLASVMIAGAGAQSAAIDESRIAAAIGCTQGDLIRIRHRLVAEGVMKGSLSNPPAEFVHDLMAAAALAGVANNGRFRDAASTFCHGLRPESVNDAVIGGRLGQLLGQFTESVSYYEGGLRLAEARANFLEQRRCLEGLRDVFDLAGGIDPISVSRRMAVWLKLIWNELQQGSQYVSAQFIEQTREQLKLLTSDEVSRAGIDRTVETEIARYQLILDTRRAEIANFIKDAKFYIKIARNPADIHYAATRLVLMSHHLCLPRQAWAAAHFALRSLDLRENPAALSSFYSDLGNFFLVENPDKTEVLWNAGLKAIESWRRDGYDDERQRIHSRVNTTLIASVLRPNEGQLENVVSLCDELAARGITNPFLKLQNCLGALRFHCGDRKGAVLEWQKGLQIARSNSMRMYEWPYYHNLAIASLAQANVEEAVQLLQRAAATIQPFLLYISNSAAMQPLIDTLQSKETTLIEDGKEPLDLLLFPPETYTSISITGSITRFAHACMLFERHLGRDMRCQELMPYVTALPDMPDNAPLLAVECHGDRYLLAVE